jgi:hypothetical protein
MHDSIEELIVDKKAIKLSAKVRDVDRQYEKNNNCEVDNGVYNKFAYDTNSKDEDGAPLNPLASNEQSLDSVDSPKKDEVEPSSPEVAHKQFPLSQNDAAVQALLLKSLVPPPLDTGTLFDNLPRRSG